MKKVFRIVRNKLSKEGEKSCKSLIYYRIEVRHTILFFIHWWDTPEFEPPHNFVNIKEAFDCIYEHYPDAVVWQLLNGWNIEDK